jgi:hypothetical protein
MQPSTTTNALLSVISILVLVIIIVLGPGGCKDRRGAMRPMPGRYQVVTMPGPDGGPGAQVVVDTATGSARPLQVEPAH